MKKPKYFVGIDISSADFAVSVGTEPWKIVGKTATFDNHPDGYEALLAWLRQQGIQVKETVVCMEATGVYGEGLAYHLSAHEFRVAIEAPLKVKRAFMPYGHKNDRVDSRQIAEYSCRFYDELRFWQPREEILEQIKVLLSTREHFTRQKSMHRNALKALKRKIVATPFAENLHQQSIERIQKSIQQIDDEIQRLIDQDPKYRQLISLLTSIPCVGFLLATNILLIMETSPKDPTNYKQLAAYIGICPYEYQSGTSVFRPASDRHHGPGQVRKLLYLAALSARTHHPQFKHYFLRKKAEGKPGNLILNNIANKLLRIMCAVVRTQTPYIPNYRSVNPTLL